MGFTKCWFLLVSLKLQKTCGLEQWSPTFLAPGTGYVEDNFSMDGGGGGGVGFRTIHVHYIYCALYCHYYYIVIYNEIII